MAKNDSFDEFDDPDTLNLSPEEQAQYIAALESRYPADDTLTEDDELGVLDDDTEEIYDWRDEEESLNEDCPSNCEDDIDEE